MSNAPEVGTRFTNRAARRWRDDEGNRHTHAYTLECRVTEVTADGFTWERLAVLNESDRPETDAFLPEHGQMARFGWEAAMNRGDVAILTEDIVARFSHAQQAADSAVLRSAAEGVSYTARYDAETDTHVVTR